MQEVLSETHSVLKTTVQEVCCIQFWGYMAKVLGIQGMKLSLVLHALFAGRHKSFNFLFYLSNDSSSCCRIWTTPMCKALGIYFMPFDFLHYCAFLLSLDLSFVPHFPGSHIVICASRYPNPSSGNAC